MRNVYNRKPYISNTNTIKGWFKRYAVIDVTIPLLIRGRYICETDSYEPSYENNNVKVKDLVLYGLNYPANMSYRLGHVLYDWLIDESTHLMSQYLFDRELESSQARTEIMFDLSFDHKPDLVKIRLIVPVVDSWSGILNQDFIISDSDRELSDSFKEWLRIDYQGRRILVMKDDRLYDAILCFNEQDGNNYVNLSEIRTIPEVIGVYEWSTK